MEKTTDVGKLSRKKRIVVNTLLSVLAVFFFLSFISCSKGNETLHDKVRNQAIKLLMEEYPTYSSYNGVTTRRNYKSVGISEPYEGNIYKGSSVSSVTVGGYDLGDSDIYFILRTDSEGKVIEFYTQDTSGYNRLKQEADSSVSKKASVSNGLPAILQGEAGGMYILFDTENNYPFSKIEVAPFDIVIDSNGNFAIGDSLDVFLDLCSLPDGVHVGPGLLKDSEGNYLYINGTDTYNEADCTRKGIGDGQYNTNLIIATIGDDYNSEGERLYYAAQICDDLVYNGFDDWFLPSYEEVILFQEVCKELGFEAGTAAMVTSSEFSDVRDYIARGGFGDNTKIRIRPMRYSYSPI